MKERETMKDYTSKLVEVINQIELYEEDMKDQRIVEKVLSLTDKFDSEIVANEESKNLNKLSLT